MKQGPFMGKSPFKILCNNTNITFLCFFNSVTPNMESNQYTYWPLPNMLKWAYASIAFNLLLTFCQ